MFYWDDSLLFGIKEIDDEHIELCKRANRLFDAFVEGKIVSEISSCMQYFKEYIDIHFANEEKLQQEINYPKYIEHKQKHEEFKLVCEGLRHEIEQNGITSNFVQKFNGIVIDWLISHLRETDAELAEYFKSYKK